MAAKLLGTPVVQPSEYGSNDSAIDKSVESADNHPTHARRRVVAEIDGCHHVAAAYALDSHLVRPETDPLRVQFLRLVP